MKGRAYSAVVRFAVGDNDGIGGGKGRASRLHRAVVFLELVKDFVVVNPGHFGGTALRLVIRQ